jgi:hypothetical protein
MRGLARQWDWRKIKYREVGGTGGNTTQKITQQNGKDCQHTVLKYTAHTHSKGNKNGGHSVSICLQWTWMASNILTWDDYASPPLLIDCTSLYCFHHITSYYFHIIFCSNIYIYTDTPWLILGFWCPVCKVITSFRNNWYMYINSLLVQQHKVIMDHTPKYNHACSIIMNLWNKKQKNKVHKLARTRTHTHTHTHYINHSWDLQSVTKE